MSAGRFWVVTLTAWAGLVVVEVFLGFAVGRLVIGTAVVLLVMFGVDAVLNVRRSWAAYRDHGDWPGES